jgi:hypothetical protein
MNIFISKTDFLEGIHCNRKNYYSIILSKRTNKNLTTMGKAMPTKTISNRKTRGALARCYIQSALNNPHHLMYTASDVEFAKRLRVTRLTVINIRREMGLKGRNSRVIDLLLRIDTTTLTIKALCARLCLKYPNTYKLVRKMGLKTRPDIRPIDTMIEYQKRNRKGVCC